MEYTQKINNKICDVAMNGKFTFADHQIFRNILGTIKNDGITSLNLNMAGVEFVDSAALGMLLIAREESDKQGVKLVLQNPSGQIEKMFKVSKFDALFNIV